VTVEALDSDFSVPTRLDDLGQPISIVFVGVVYLATHGRLRMPRIKAHYRKPHRLQRMPMPGGQGTAFESNPRNIRCFRSDRSGDVFGYRETFSLPDNLSVAAENA
jgi:hypothetical protein